MEYQGECMYCHQMHFVHGGDGMNQGEVDKLATLQCDCDEAKAYQEVEQRKTYADANVKELFDDCGAIKDVLLKMTGIVAAKDILRVSITDGNGVQGKMTIRDSKIKVERVEIERKSLED